MIFAVAFIRDAAKKHHTPNQIRIILLWKKLL